MFWLACKNNNILQWTDHLESFVDKAGQSNLHHLLRITSNTSSTDVDRPRKLAAYTLQMYLDLVDCIFTSTITAILAFRIKEGRQAVTVN